MRTLTSLALLLALIPVPMVSPDPAADRYLSTMQRLGRFNGVALIARSGKVFRKAYGFADFGSRTPLTIDSQFEIASLTKMFTALAILKLRDRGLLRLSDSICRYLNPCGAGWGPITLDELLHHRSGIPDYENALDIESPAYYAFMTQADSSRRILQREMPLPLDFVPGTKFSYSNTGYIALGFVVEAVAKQPYATFLRENVFAPAGMSATGVLGADPAPRLVRAYEPADVTWTQRLAGFSWLDIHAMQVPKLALTPPAGDGGVFSTVNDLYRWTQIMQGADPAVLSERDRREVVSGIDGYGDGWAIGTGFDLPRWSHTGELPGFLSAVAMYPTAGVTTIFMSNVDTPTAALDRDLQAIAVRKPYDQPYSGALVKLTNEQQNALTGAYTLQDGDIVCISRDPDMLAARVKNKYTAGLLPFSPTQFYMPLSSGLVTFSTDSNTKAKQIDLRYNGVDHRGTATSTACPQSSSAG